MMKSDRHCHRAGNLVLWGTNIAGSLAHFYRVLNPLTHLKDSAIIICMDCECFFTYVYAES